MSVFFTRSTTELKLDNPTQPEGAEPSPRQVVGYSIGGGIKVARTGEDDIMVRLNFVRMTQAEYNNLSSFIKSTITYTAYTFQYQDWNQATLNNMRYISGFDTFKSARGGYWSGTLVLKEDLGI